MSSQRIQLGTAEIGGAERVVLVSSTGVSPLADAPDMRTLIADWGRMEARVRATAQAPQAEVPIEQVRWCPPVIARKVLCVGSNYHDHIAEMEGPAGVAGGAAPFPFSFLKPATTLVGSGREVRHPSYGRRLDWEAELAVVIGDGAAARGGEPLDAVFGYTILNDLSLRDFLPFPHALGLDAVASKGFDGAAPVGPWITLSEDVPDPQDLPIELTVNGEVMQRSSTASMVFGVRDLVAHFARLLTLEAGDIIATGTPAGVGAGRRPPRFLRPGDVVVARIGELGMLTTTITTPERDDPLMDDSEGTDEPAQ